MNTWTDPRWLAFLARILESPADVSVRLVAADWLEENAGTVRCTNCEGRGYNYPLNPIQARGCPTCQGTGCISDDRAERAEFIRVQVELARIGSLHPPADDEDRHLIQRHHVLRRREAALLCENYGLRWAMPLLDILGWSKPHALVGSWTWRRGFIEEIICLEAEWIAARKAIVLATPLRAVTFRDCGVTLSHQAIRIARREAGLPLGDVPAAISIRSVATVEKP